MFLSDVIQGTLFLFSVADQSFPAAKLVIDSEIFFPCLSFRAGEL